MQSVAVARLSAHNVVSRNGRQSAGQTSDEQSLSGECGSPGPKQQKSKQIPPDPIGLDEKICQGQGGTGKTKWAHGFVDQVFAQRGDLR